MSDNPTLSPPGHTPQSVMDTTTYGDTVTIDDLDLKTGRTEIPGVRLWGHRVVLSGDGIECKECEMEREIPELLQMTNGFREVVYKMYILGEFRDTRCEPDMGQHGMATVNYDPNNIYTLRTDNGTVTTDGGYVIDSTDPMYDSGQMLTDEEFLPIVAKNQNNNFNSIGDIQGGMSDMPGVRDTTLTTGTTSVDVSDETSKQTFARKLCEKVGLR